METILKEILKRLRAGEHFDDRRLAKLLLRQNRGRGGNKRHYAKKQLLPYYLTVKESYPKRWAAWDVSTQVEERLVALLRVKPRRTASGVATITVITKPWPCANDCLYCPSDVRMPKSYLSDEPACQRAERNWFDPYLQVTSRLRALTHMGHATDKVELIILGGTWSDYPEGYQIWFVSELFRALNDAGSVEDDRVGGGETSDTEDGETSDAEDDNAEASGAGTSDNTKTGDAKDGEAGGVEDFPKEAMIKSLRHVCQSISRPAALTDGAIAVSSGTACRLAGREVGASSAAQAGNHHFPRERRRFYRVRGCPNRPEDVAARVSEVQRQVNSGALSYNRAVEQLYARNHIWEDIASEQMSTFADLARQHIRNESAQHRVVGLAVETRPDCVTVDNLRMLRRLGCTKVQVGVQSVSRVLLKMNNRHGDLAVVRRAFELLRVFGFKIHAHFMLNLYGASPEDDKRDYRRFVTEKPYLPDEVKLYPCSLVRGTGLCECHERGSWRPYSEDELLDILAADMLATPGFTRISRMMRDISAGDIVAGNRKANLRQMVESRLEAAGEAVLEIRYREIGTSEADLKRLCLRTLCYETGVSDEYFLEWVTPENRIAAFLRLSLPRRSYVLARQTVLPVGPGEAMIREVHVYGRAARLRAAAVGRPDAAGAPDMDGQHQAQHRGLGRRLISAACDIAWARGYKKINVISSVGTREYYRALGFADKELYQQKLLTPPHRQAPNSKDNQ